MSDKKKKIIIVISGKKGAGKNTLANQIIAELLNRRLSLGVRVNDQGLLVTPINLPTVGDKVTAWNGKLGFERVIDTTPPNVSSIVSGAGIRVLSFAETLKEFCISVLGLRPEQCWGTDEQKNTPTHIRWESLPLGIRWKYAKKSLWPGTWLRRGLMTGREVMQVFGTDVVRQMYSDAWARSTYSCAVRIPEPVVIIPDGRFPNEIIGDNTDLSSPEWDVTVKKIRSLRNPFNDKHVSETALDNFPQNQFHMVLPPNTTMRGQAEAVDHIVCTWIERALGVGVGI